jgi:FixJ family two-component response regulator
MVPDLKVLFMSGYTADTILQGNTLESGIHFIEKPFPAQKLLHHLHEIMTSAGK